MKTTLLKVIPKNKLTFEELTKYVYDEFDFEIYCVPTKKFEAKLYSYLNKYTNGETTIVSDKKLLKLKKINSDGSLIFSVSINDYIKEDRLGNLKSNFYQCKTNFNDGYVSYANNRVFYTTNIRITKEQYEENLIICNDHFTLYFIRNYNYFNFFDKIKQEKIVYDFINPENINKLSSQEGLITYCITKPIMEIYQYCGPEVLKTHIYDIIDKLDTLIINETHFSKDRYIEMLNEIYRYLKNIIESNIIGGEQ